MDKKLFKTRDEIYKRCPSVFWGVSVFFVIVAIALSALEAALPGLYLYYITFSLILLPLLFSTFVTLFTIKYGGTVSLKSTFTISRSYFTPGNFGCFRAIRCLLHALLVFLIACLVIPLILDQVFAGVYGETFVQEYNNFINMLASDIKGAATYLEQDTPVRLYFLCGYCFSFSLGLFAFVFGIAFNAINVYLCISIPNATANYCTTVFNNFFRKRGGSYRKDFWVLNWPLFALLLLGIACGYVFTFMLDIDFGYGKVISTLFGIVCLIPFAPTYFANMEALFAKYNSDMKRASNDLTQGFLQNIRQNMNLSEEDRKKIDELLSKEDKKEETDSDNDETKEQ